MTTVSEALTESKVDQMAESMAEHASDAAYAADDYVRRSATWKELEQLDPEAAERVSHRVRIYLGDWIVSDVEDQIRAAIEGEGSE